ncbi:tachykinin-3b [Embiotoca jacksoni]|uniref:tachykinin-3b n=1 Tax=Embiotoca jacksoni TaxID=100190 RepID=UPI00370465C3
MEKTPNCCSVASLVALLLLVFLPVSCWCKEDAYMSLRQVKPGGCVGEDAVLKRFGDVDYDGFVSLMGRRSAAPPNSQRNTAVSRKRHVDDILDDLLGRRT